MSSRGGRPVSAAPGSEQATTAIDDRELHAFATRHQFLLPTISILLIDTKHCARAAYAVGGTAYAGLWQCC